MAIKFQYNKTSLQQLEKQLKVRVRTLPIIKNKESALRMEVKRCKTEAAGLEERLEKQIQAYEAMFALWNEFDASLIKVSDVHLGIKKIAGVRVPLLENVDFDIRTYSLFNSPKWIVQRGSTKRDPCFAVGTRRKWPLDFRRGGCRLRRCTPSDEPSWNKKRSVRCCSANRNCKSRLRRSSGGWLLVSGSLRRAGSIKGCTAGQVEKLRWDAELRGPCKICRADFV